VASSPISIKKWPLKGGQLLVTLACFVWLYQKMDVASLPTALARFALGMVGGGGGQLLAIAGGIGLAMENLDRGVGGASCPPR
jgi:hypothetical protein